MTPKQLGLYLATASIWGCTWFFILKVVIAFGGGGVALRAILGSFALYLAALAAKRKLNFGAIGPLAFVGATTVAGQLLGFNLATPMAGTAVTAILASTIPMFAMAIGHVRKVEHISRIGFIGLLLGFFGSVLIIGFPSVDYSLKFFLGCVLCLIGAISAAVGGIYTKSHLQNIGYWEQTIGSFFLGGLMMLPMFLINPPTHTPAPIDYFYLAVLSIISTGIGYITYFRLVAEIGATPALTVEFLVTVIAVAIGAGFLGEHISAIQFVGVASILIGCSLVLDLIPFNRLRPAK